jgi:hypothetical protein
MLYVVTVDISTTRFKIFDSASEEEARRSAEEETWTGANGWKVADDSHGETLVVDCSRVEDHMKQTSERQTRGCGYDEANNWEEEQEKEWEQEDDPRSTNEFYGGPTR